MSRKSYSSHAKIPFGRKQISPKHVEKEIDVVGLIIAFESGELNDESALKLFSHLVKTGQAWTLQGYYGRTAKQLIDVGHIGEDGEILIDVD